MEKKSFKLNGIYIAALVIIQNVLTFLPFYTNEKGDTASIQGFIWLRYAEFKTYFTENIPGYFLADEVLFPVLSLFLSLLIVALGIFKYRSIVTYVFTYIWCALSYLAFFIPKTVPFGNQTLFIANVALISVALIVTIICHITTVKENKKLYAQED